MKQVDGTARAKVLRLEGAYVKHFTVINALMIHIQFILSFPLEMWKESQVNWDKTEEGRGRGRLESPTCLAINGHPSRTVGVQEPCGAETGGQPSPTKCWSCCCGWMSGDREQTWVTDGVGSMETEIVPNLLHEGACGSQRWLFWA